MKKLIGVLVVAVGAYLGLTYYGGYAGERAFKLQLEQSAVQGEVHGYEVELVSYDRGFMSADMVMTVRMDLTSMGLDEVALTSNTKIQDRKSTRLNSSHVAISYAVFCLKKKKKRTHKRKQSPSHLT